ncbi:cytochrome P450 2J3 isoform X2 [Puntigrus tetrazona]|uniref:cytochrome P450 2J3 isoform X2 n=1 Tax=Puntigrus tetrazona TaxID=1606681 RepID=UPI001C8ABC07|nr:cytochrome P450 2J3 isoform X2 [Puntigrus tetrazona]
MVLENMFLSLLSVLWTDARIVFLLFVIFLLISEQLRNRKPRNYPPGPTPLPFIGNIYNLDTTQPHIQLTKLSDQYGNIFSLRLGSLNTVVVNTYGIVKKVLADQADIFTGRPTNDVLKRIIKCQGVTFNNGYSWKQQRRFTVNTLKYFGVGKRSLEVIIMEEYNFLHQSIMDTNEVDKHYADWTPSSPRDFIDCYLTEIQKRKDHLEAGFHEEGLQYAVLDLFVAGTETTSTTLLWAFVYMMKYPEIQEKVQEEIDKVVGRSRQPIMNDRSSMPYTDAVIHEVQRMGNVVPLSVPRMTNEDTILEGYFIPKGTQIIPNLTSVLFDQTKWKTPHSFDPQNFLNTQGEFEKPEAFIPFSAGKRSCPGETLARMELFLFFTSFLQSYTLSPPEGTQTSLEFKFGITLSPKTFTTCFTPR